MRVLFAHGFEGGPSGSKPTFMRESLGWDVRAPVMSDLGWDIEKQTEVLLREIDESDYDLVIGSSMGGLAAANASSLRGGSGFRLLLIAPAFGLYDSWEGLTKEELSEWREVGTRRYKGFELDMDLGWGFMEAAGRMSWPEPLHRTTIVHGTKDDVVSIEVSRKVAREAAMVELVEIDDGHRMKECLHLLSGLSSELMSRGA